MKRAPSISVIVPVFNCEIFLAQSLNSLQRQSYENFEVIISDDASTDRSVEIAQKWQSKDPRFKLFEHSKNVGMTQNWNQALQYVSGTYVMKLDADDAYGTATLERLLKAISEHNVEIAFCRTLECDHKLSIQNTYRGERALYNAGIAPSIDTTKTASEWYQLTLGDAQLWHSNAFIVPTELMKTLGGWNEQFGCASDTDLIFRLLEQNINVSHVNYLGVLYRMREGSISHDFRQNDTLIDEVYTASLSSVQRFYASGKKLSYEAKLNWYRIYQNAQNRKTISSNNMHYDVHNQDFKLPAHIAFLGSFQRVLYALKNKLIGAT